MKTEFEDIDFVNGCDIYRAMVAQVLRKYKTRIQQELAINIKLSNMVKMGLLSYSDRSIVHDYFLSEREKQ